MIALVNLFLTGFAVNAWLDSNSDETTREKSTDLSRQMFVGGLVVFVIGLLAGLG